MPLDSMIVSAFILGVFVIFGSVLYWGERRTRAMSAANEAEKAKRRSF
jgi:hypothetical protein